LNDLAEKYSVTAMPTFLLIKNGNKITEVVGADQNKLKAAIESNK